MAPDESKHTQLLPMHLTTHSKGDTFTTQNLWFGASRFCGKTVARGVRNEVQTVSCSCSGGGSSRHRVFPSTEGECHGIDFRDCDGSFRGGCSGRQSDAPQCRHGASPRSHGGLRDRKSVV